METEIPINAVRLVKKWEGLHKKKTDGMVYPYLCPAGVWTIGYGSTRHFDGSPIRKDTPPLSPQDCESLMLLELGKCVRNAVALSPILVQYPETLGAIASFIYNLGISRYRASTLRRMVNIENWPESQTQIRKWVYSNGMRLAGLVARRNEESTFLGT
jgi:lysozyme